MTTKQEAGQYAPDGAKYGTVTDGAGNLQPVTTTTTGNTKQPGAQAPDGSIYFTITDGESTLL